MKYILDPITKEVLQRLESEMNEVENPSLFHQDVMYICKMYRLEHRMVNQLAKMREMDTDHHDELEARKTPNRDRLTRW